MTSIRWHSHGTEELHRNWGWFLALGILLIVLGLISLGYAVAMTIASVLLFGWLMIIGGVMEIIHAFRARGWSGTFIELLTGILYAVAGFMMIANPGVAAVTLTLLIALLLMFSGIFRIGAALMTRFPHWGWLALHGVVNLMLGIAIWRQWPFSGLWVIGLFVGIDMLFNGWALVMLAMAARRMPASQWQT
jgi:uncharacterized membrane protein HdeD (DUF308 family)